jgi:hypothetical protein
MVKTGANKNSGNFTRIKVDGREFLIPIIEKPWDVRDVKVEDIKRYEEDFFIQNVYLKLTNFIFIGQPIFNVIQGDRSREDLAKWVRGLVQKIGFVQFMKLIWYDTCIWGNNLHSDGVDRIGNKWEYTEFRALPPELFSEPSNNNTLTPDWNNPNFTFGRMLKGIEKREDGKIHYWQKGNDGIPTEIKNIKHIKSPVRTYYLDGVPLFNPLYKLLPKVYFSLDQLMMQNNRSNILFLGIDDTGKQTLPDNKTSKWEYSKHVLKAADNRTWFPLPGGVEPKELKTQISDISLKTIDLLTDWLISYITPTEVISKGDGTFIGGSSNYEAQMFKIFSESLQNFIALEAEKILDQLLIWNGWSDCHVEVKMKKLTFDDAKLDLDIAKLVLEAQKVGYTIASINEFRNRLSWEDADLEFLQESQEEWEAVKKEVEIPAMQQGNLQENSQDKTQAKTQDDDKNQDKNKNRIIKKARTSKLPKKEEKSNGKAIEENLKQNQGNVPDRKEIEEKTDDYLKHAISKCFEELGKVRS